MQHPNVKCIRTRLENHKGARTTVVEVVTDLPLNPTHPKYDAYAIDVLTQSLVSHWQNNPLWADRLDFLEADDASRA